MKISSVKIKDFRGYKGEVEIPFGNLTVLVGKNDIGKSTILEALDIFFNDGKGAVKPEKDDLCKLSDAKQFSIAVEFDNLPAEIVIDDTNKTNLKDEFMLNEHNKLEILKIFDCSKATPKPSVFIRALHPTNPKCAELLTKTQTALRKLVGEEGISDCNKNVNAEMRRRLWEKYADDLQLRSTEIDIPKDGDAKNIWEKLEQYLPIYSLFQSDRKNSDGDSEVQDPLKEAVKQILSDGNIKQHLEVVAQSVKEHLATVSKGTLEQLKKLDEKIANSLNPKIPETVELKWADVFKSVSISGDNDIPINKRGSGVKRLILISFFRAEAERRAKEKGNRCVVYAIEEPETSQHNANQTMLAKTFKALSEADETQILLTTHSAYMVKQLEAENLRLIKATEEGKKEIEKVQPGLLGYVSLNEISYMAFGDISTEYHDELYGYLQEEKTRWEKYKEASHDKVPYRWITNNGNQKEEDKCKTEYIRHQIHHPENKLNDYYYTLEDLKQSIISMREFIQAKRAQNGEK